MFLALNCIGKGTLGTQGSILVFFEEISKKLSAFEGELDVAIEGSESIREFIEKVDSVYKEQCCWLQKLPYFEVIAMTILAVLP